MLREATHVVKTKYLLENEVADCAHIENNTKVLFKWMKDKVEDIEFGKFSGDHN